MTNVKFTPKNMVVWLAWTGPPAPARTHYKLKNQNLVLLPVVYFDQLSGAACFEKLVLKYLFHIFGHFFFVQFDSTVYIRVDNKWPF